MPVQERVGMKKTVFKIICCVVFIICIFMFVINHYIFSGDMTDKKDIFEITQANKDLINNAVYVIYSNNIFRIYDTEDMEPPDGVTGIDGKYIVIDTGEGSEYEPIYSYEPLTDEYLTAMFNIDKLKSVRIEGAIINLYFGGRGIIPSGACSGVYYFPNDNIADAESIYNHVFERSGDGWIYRPETGDDSFYVERICENLWYYEEKW